MNLNKKLSLNYTINPLRKENIPDYISKELLNSSLKNNKLISLPYLSANANLNEYLEYFNNGWLLTETLFSALKYEESFYLKPYHKLRHPLIFYYGHVASFYVNKMLVSNLISKPIHKDFETIFETGVDEMSWDINTKQNDINWPSLDKVIAYRIEVYNLVIKIIKQNSKLFAEDINAHSPIWSLLMSFEHERIHFETSSVLMRELDLEHLSKPDLFPDLTYKQNTANYPQPEIDYSRNSFIEIKGAKGKISKNDLNSFGWDNEFGYKDYNLAEFKVNNLLISNGEFFEFVKDGGYHEDSYWSEKGLAWRKYSNIYKPTFWYADGPKGSNLYKLRTCFKIIDMQWRFPVIVNHFEAKAFCNYKAAKDGKNYRLLNETEHRLLSKSEDEIVKAKTNNIYNFNLKSSSENEVELQKSEATVIYDLHGNLWQWLEDDFYPLNNFQVHKYYTDFSSPCFDGEHKMIAGSSFFSTGNLASIYSRYHFRPHFFQHAGFRLAYSPKEAKNSNLKIEFETINPNNGKLYIIYSRQEKLNIMEKSLFYKKYPQLKT